MQTTFLSPDVSKLNPVATRTTDLFLGVVVPNPAAQQLISVLNVEAIGPLATRVRRNLSGPSAPICMGLEYPIVGNSNFVCVLKFADGLKWVLRIPFTGTRDGFTHAEALRLRSHALAIQYLKKHTSIPIPYIYEFKTDINNSEIGTPYILMSFVDGVPLEQRWFDKRVEPAVLRDRRLQTLKSVATAMAHLQGLEFPNIGELQFGDPPSLAVTDITEYKFDHTQIGPLSTARDFFLRPFSILNGMQLDDPKKMGMVELLRMIIECIPASTPSTSGAPPESFVLAHPTYLPRKFLIAGDGTLASIIGWDGLKSVPHCRGYSAYPSWITKDWDPDVYLHNPSRHKQQNSLEELEGFRREWDRIMSGLLGGDYVPKTHLFEAVSRASESDCRMSTVTKICTEAFEGEPLFETPAWTSQGSYNPYYCFFQYIVHALGTGTLEPAKRAILQEKFRAFFRI